MARGDGVSRAPATADDGVPLAHVAEVLGPSVLRVLAGPGLDDVIAREVVIYDVTEPPTLRAGDVVLGVGLTATSRQTRRVVREAGQASCAALVVRSVEPDLPQLRQDAHEHGVTVMVLPAAMRWEHASLLISSALAVLPTGSGDEPVVGDLFGFADALAGRVGGAVTVEDARSRVLAYSTLDEEDLDTPRREAILGRRVPEAYLEHLHRSGVFEALESSDDVVEVVADERLGLRRRLVVPVRANGELLGSLWVQEGRVPLGEPARAALAQAARTAPGHFIWAQSAGLTVRQRREDLLRGLLAGDADVPAAADALGFDPEAGCAVLAVALDSAGRLGSEHEAFSRIDELLRARALAFRRLVAGVLVGGRYLVLVPELTGPRDQVDSGLERLARSLCQDAERAGLAVRVACGPFVPRLAEAASTVATVERILQFLAREPARGRVATAATARAALAVSQAVGALAEVAELQQGPVTVLLDYDRRHGTDHHATLGAWLDSLGDVALAARALNVHRNTVRYRLQRIVEVCGVRLDDSEERLVAMLQLRVAGVWPRPQPPARRPRAGSGTDLGA